MADDLKKVLDDLDFATSKISEQTRTISLGVLALAWLFLAGGKSAPVLPVAVSPRALLLCVALAIGSLVADYVQYVIAYSLSHNVLERVESNLGATPKYAYDSLGFRSRIFFFWLKQVICIASLCVLGTTVTCALVGA